MSEITVKVEAPELATALMALAAAMQGAVPVQPGPVADLDREPEPGQRRNASQAAKPAHDVGVSTVGGQGCDPLIETITAGRDRDNSVVGLIERGLNQG